MKPASTPFRVARVRSPLGRLFVVVDGDDMLRALDFDEYETRMRRLLHAQYGGRQDALVAGVVPRAITDALDAYFAGQLGALDALPTRTGGTAFQREVWAALRAIPPGATTSYAALAARIGRPAACRAVGLANGANPIALVVPCHRVIGASGALTGYGGGLDRKRWLLAHEQKGDGPFPTRKFKSRTVPFLPLAPSRGVDLALA
jgi:O-6-methylguanine DNA methyltransferase